MLSVSSLDTHHHAKVTMEMTRSNRLRTKVIKERVDTESVEIHAKTSKMVCLPGENAQ